VLQSMGLLDKVPFSEVRMEDGEDVGEDFLRCYWLWVVSDNSKDLFLGSEWKLICVCVCGSKVVVLVHLKLKLI